MGKKAPVEEPSNRAETELIIYQNPAIFTGANLIQIQQKYGSILNGNQFGTVVGIKTNMPLQQTPAATYGIAHIYDAVGNLVAKNFPVGKTATGVYGVYWNGQNRFGRYVGTGTYLMVVSFTDYSGNESIKKIKIGVRK